MVMLLTRMHQIANREGFEIEVFRKTGRGKRALRLRQNGVLDPYRFARKLKDGKTVNDWKRERFEAAYPGYTCNVLKGDGSIATGQTTLRTVRRSY